MTTLLHHPSAEALLTTVFSSATDDRSRADAFQSLVEQPITPEILASGVHELRQHMVLVNLGADAIDTCGTGGSGRQTINTSSLSAFIVAAAGGKVAKHGNRSASGNCGCFDLLESLGVRIDLTPEQERKIFDVLGIVFLFAPLHHPVLRSVAALRKLHGKKTLFNLLGPLCNPANVTHQIIGTGNHSDAQLISEALHTLGSVGSMVVTGHDGLDEVTVTTGTTVRRVLDREVRSSEFIPGVLGVPLAARSEIVGGNADTNAKIFLELARGEGNEEMRNLILVNAAHALLLTPLVVSLHEAFELAKQTLESGKVFDLFFRYRDLSHSLQS